MCLIIMLAVCTSIKHQSKKYGQGRQDNSDKVPHNFRSRVSTSTNPCINKAIHRLLIHGFGNITPGH